MIASTNSCFRQIRVNFSATLSSLRKAKTAKTLFNLDSHKLLFLNYFIVYCANIFDAVLFAAAGLFSRKS